MSQNGMFDYNDFEHEEEIHVAPKKTRSILTSREKLWSLLVGFLFGVVAIVVAVAMQHYLDFSFEYFVYGIPVAGLTYLIKRDGNITIFVILGYVLGSYVLTYILGFIFIGYILFS